MVLMGILFRKYISSVIRQKEDLKADVDRKNKARQIFRENEHFLHPVRTRT